MSRYAPKPPQVFYAGLALVLTLVLIEAIRGSLWIARSWCP